jgi:hypothetical protein
MQLWRQGRRGLHVWRQLWVRIEELGWGCFREQQRMQLRGQGRCKLHMWRQLRVRIE